MGPDASEFLAALDVVQSVSTAESHLGRSLRPSSGEMRTRYHICAALKLTVEVAHGPTDMVLRDHHSYALSLTLYPSSTYCWE